jgi:hypothetical protein
VSGQGWQCQGRQEHGWFGQGTCAADAGGAAGEDIAASAQTVLHGVLGHLPAGERARW